MHTENVVVDREHLEGERPEVTLGTASNRHLRVVDSGEVARTSWLVFFWLEREGVRVDTRAWRTGVVGKWLHLVKVLTGLLLESVLAVEDQLGSRKRTDSFFNVVHGTGIWTSEEHWGTGLGRTDSNVSSTRTRTRADDNITVSGLLTKVPQVVTSGSTIRHTPDQFLDWVVVRQSDLLGPRFRQGISTSVLNLLDQVFVTLLRESSALFSVEVHVVTPHLQASHVVVKLRGQVNVDSDFVVLQSNQWQGQSWVAVEEEDEWQVNLLGRSADWVSRHLSVVELGPFGQVQFRVQSPPSLVVLVNSLTTDGQFRSRDNTLSGPVRISSGTRDVRQIIRGSRFEVHVTDQITVSGDSDGDATRGRGSTVNSLFDGFHRKVGVAFVNRLEKSDFWVTCKVDVLGAIGDELHETSGHCVCFVLYTKIFFSDNFAKKHKLVFPGVYKMSTETEPQKVPEEDEMEEEFSESESENEEIESTVDENEIEDEIGDEIDISDEDLGEYMDETIPGLDDIGGLLSSVLANEDGETVCSALVNISRTLEVQNKIMIKILSQLQNLKA